MKIRTLKNIATLCAALLATHANAGQITTKDDVLIFSGDSSREDIARLKSALTPDIKTVVLDGVKGNDYTDGWDLAAVIKSAHVTTVVKGFCNYNCVRMFLSGQERMFADTKPLNRTSLFISGNAHLYDSSGVMYTDEGQINALIAMPRGDIDKWAFREHWGANNSFSPSFMMVFHPSIKAFNMGSMIGCPGGTKPAEMQKDCSSVGDFNADSTKIITTSELFKIPE